MGDGRAEGGVVGLDGVDNRRDFHKVGARTGDDEEFHEFFSTLKNRFCTMCKKGHEQ
jgi:hypothetical protein